MNAQAVTLRTAIESIRRVTPLKSMLMPTSVPTHGARRPRAPDHRGEHQHHDTIDEQPPAM
jgi:hypothetical protein